MTYADSLKIVFHHPRPKPAPHGYVGRYAPKRLIYWIRLRESWRWLTEKNLKIDAINRGEVTERHRGRYAGLAKAA